MDIIVKPLQLDRVEMSFRIGEGSVVPLQIVNDTIDFYVRNGLARPIALYPFQRGNSLARHVAINLSRLPKNTLTVAAGTSSGRGNGRFQWVKFGFCPNRLLLHSDARASFMAAMNDLLPGGGYSELLAGGNVIYTEFAVDVLCAHVAMLDAYSPKMDLGQWVLREGETSTIYINKSRNRSETAFSIYDKARSDKETLRRIRRFPILRIEAKRRFNHNPSTRLMTVSDLKGVRNPFSGLGIYEKSLLGKVFSAACHGSFLQVAQTQGIQTALAQGAAGMRERRLRMMQKCTVSWWRPELAWRGLEGAVEVLHELGR